jgi:hypothetical protein
MRIAFRHVHSGRIVVATTFEPTEAPGPFALVAPFPQLRARATVTGWLNQLRARVTG